MPRRGQAKTPVERQNYSRLVKQAGGEDTERKPTAETLEGTDQVSIPITDEPQLVKAPSVKSKIKGNWRRIILDVGIAVIAALIVFIIQWSVEVRADIKYLEHAVEDNRGRIEKLEGPGLDEYSLFVTKENLELRLQLIEKDLKAAMPDTADIEKRIEDIEKDISKLMKSE